jgi:multidrug transporter EmrE-like cation transporter
MGVWLELLSFPVAIAAGQILFKRAASQLAPEGGAWLWQLARLPSMWLAMVLYAASTLLWVRILTTVPLSRAYPFVALAFVLVPIAGYLLYDEPVNARYAFGAALIIVPIFISVGSNSGSTPTAPPAVTNGG